MCAYPHRRTRLVCYRVDKMDTLLQNFLDPIAKVWGDSFLYCDASCRASAKPVRGSVAAGQKKGIKKCYQKDHIVTCIYGEGKLKD